MVSAAESRRGRAAPSDLDCMLAFKPGFDSRFTLGTMVSCSTLVGVTVAAVALLGAPLMIADGETGVSLTAHAAPVFVNSCEGYWPPPEVCVPLGERYKPFSSGELLESKECPQRHVQESWPDRAELLTKLQRIEAQAREADQAGLSLQLLTACGLSQEHFVSLKSYRGFAWSRLVQGEIVGSAEFVDASSGACWPDGFAEHYVDKFAVKPSNAFVAYVLSFDLAAFQKVLASARECFNQRLPLTSASAAP